MAEQDLKSLAPLVALCKRRGFLTPSSAIYGGLSGCYDYGPLGAELKRNLFERWWKAMTYREDVVGLDSSILMAAAVWRASGHTDAFYDSMIDCTKCKKRFREEDLDLQSSCPHCGAKSFTPPRNFNLMFKTHIGPLEDSSLGIYLRPETAQGIFVNFNYVQSTMRLKLPFGIAQIGKAFRNEITPGHFIFRLREFEQMEMQYFVRPDTQHEFFEEWKEHRLKWHLNNGLTATKLKWHPHPKDELAHYADAATDITYEFPHAQGELEGIHSRTDFDLSRHEQTSGKSLQYIDQEKGNEKYTPFVVETSLGADRAFLAILCDAYREEEERVVMKFNPKLSPIKVAILPLMKKDGLEELSKTLFHKLQNLWRIEWDGAGSIGKRYRRQDEIGTPLCVTIDYETKTHQSVTVRLRDTMEQERVSSDALISYLRDYFDRLP